MRPLRIRSAPRRYTRRPAAIAARMLRCDLCNAMAHALISESSRAALRRSRAVIALVIPLNVAHAL